MGQTLSVAAEKKGYTLSGGEARFLPEDVEWF
jgi:ABC-type tungstate transport system permease subunit